MKPTTSAWWEAYSPDIIHPAIARFFADEFEAKTITVYSSSLVCGLVQVESYMRTVLQEKASPFQYASSMTETRIKIRKQRQWHLFERPDPPKYRLLIAENVLHRPLGGIEVLREQITHLVTMAALPHVSIHILPGDFDSPFGIEPGVCYLFNPVKLNTEPILYVESYSSHMTRSQDPMQLRYFQHCLQVIQDKALGKAESLQLMEKRLAELARIDGK